eukprot:7935036-Pyramimonas_sp.AAC.1
MQPEDLAALAGDVEQLEMASDGSCEKQALRCLHRASWAIALMEPGTESLLAVLRGIVPVGLPRTPAMAEHAGAALVGQVADRPTSLALDCKAAICHTQRPLWKQLAGSNKHAGARRFAHELAGT